jgi:hypothetical protein
MYEYDDCDADDGAGEDYIYEYDDGEEEEGAEQAQVDDAQAAAACAREEQRYVVQSNGLAAMSAGLALTMSMVSSARCG